MPRKLNLTADEYKEHRRAQKKRSYENHKLHHIARVNIRSKRVIQERREAEAGQTRPEYCEVCSRKSSRDGAAICFDHDHRTGKFRGWLCDRCNVALGLVSDNPKILRDLADYLERRS